MQNADMTLHDFVLKLLTEANCREAFDSDPVAALRDAGLEDVSPQDVVDAVPLVMDFASANGLNLHPHLDGSLAGSTFSGGAEVSPHGAATGGSFHTPFAEGGFLVEGGLDGASLGAGVATPFGFARLDVTASPDGGVAISDTVSSAFASGGYDLNAGLHGVSGGGGFDLHGSDSDAFGRGGDLVTGTVASYLTDGADTLTGALTDTAGVLTGGLGSGATAPVADLVGDGVAQVPGGAADSTSIGAPTATPAGLVPELPVDVPAAASATPGLPGLPDLPELSLPSLPALPELPELPVNLPELPVELPVAPQLPSGIGDVQDVVGGVTGNVPVVSDLTDGLTDGLLGN